MAERYTLLRVTFIIPLQLHFAGLDTDVLLYMYFT
jgi:hypothetical protein